MFIAKNSCDEFILRVKRDPFFNCSIELFHRSKRSKQSTPELATEPHSRRAHRQQRAEQAVPEHFTAFAFGVLVSVSAPFSRFRQSSAGSTPAFFSRAPLAVSSRARRAEFISVSGQCAARSAHFSDLRNHKRISGGVAATEHLHAPMNSPTGAASSGTAGFLPNLSTQVH